MSVDPFYKNLFNLYWNDIKPLIANIESRSGRTAFEACQSIALIFQNLANRTSNPSNKSKYEAICFDSMKKAHIDLLGYLCYIQSNHNHDFIKRIKKTDFSKHQNQAVNFLQDIENIQKLSDTAESYIPIYAMFWNKLSKISFLHNYSLKKYHQFEFNYSSDRLKTLKALHEQYKLIETKKHLLEESLPKNQNNFVINMVYFIPRLIVPLVLFFWGSPYILNSRGDSFMIHLWKIFN